MRIGVDMKALVTNRPGIRSFLLRLLEDIAANTSPHEIVLFGPPEVLEQAAQSGLDAARFSHVRVPLRVRLGKLRLPFYDQVELSAALDRDRVDLFFCPYMDAPVVSSKPLIITVHDLVLHRFRRLYPLHVAAYLNTLCRLNVRRARRVATVSEFTKSELLRAFHVPAEKISVLPVGLPRAFCARVNESHLRALRERLALRCNYVLYTGGADPRKNLPRLFAAFGRLNSARRHTVLALTGDAAAFARYRSHWEQAGLADSIVFTGRLSEAELAALYSSAALVVYPSLWEGCGLPVLEAVACGAPVAASRAASLPEMGGSAALYFDPHDVEDMARAMHQLLADGGLRAHLRAAAARRRAELQRSQPGAVFLRLCEEALAEPRAGKAALEAPAQRTAAGQG
jgi:glycosyltransferase involved in cell wall biosynthesis